MGRNEIIQQFLESTGRMYRCMLPVKNQSFTQLKLNRSQFEVMMYLMHEEKPTIKAISQAFHMTSSAATQLIEGLVERGYVERKESSTDRRVVNVMLTKIGKAKCHEFKKMVFEQMTKKLENVSDTELLTMTKIAQKITDIATN